MTQILWIESQMDAMEDDVEHVNDETLAFIEELYATVE